MEIVIRRNAITNNAQTGHVIIGGVNTPVQIHVSLSKEDIERLNKGDAVSVTV